MLSCSALACCSCCAFLVLQVLAFEKFADTACVNVCTSCGNVSSLLGVSVLGMQSDNLLLDGPLNLDSQLPLLKVADFGLSKQKWSAYVTGVRDLRYGCRECPAAYQMDQPTRFSRQCLACWHMLYSVQLTSYGKAACAANSDMRVLNGQDSSCETS